ncbi:DUF58 domain-containing protein [Persicimonas caeni]|uniref:DUF58 domain-containing protein n=1 Tax=Persicimonas caeni TaxID=2292766 RepID=A0A4Y6Q1F7_PERCE|nr:DUF58 domain-containing protein [Persicimonas caeni]QDG54352.1 DUF58 domain-containing protein [Persicimonas caeni]QED35573.1 DUF58 domain-containing protein [Persicimonas caeni]
MNPHLTTRGVFVFVCAIVFLAAGAVTEQPLLLLLGQVQVAVLAISFLLCVVAALALDRRFVRIEVRDDSGSKRFRSTGVMTGEKTDVDVYISNDAWVPLYGLALEPFGARALGLGDIDDYFHLPTKAEVSAPLTVEAARSGRWTLQGFDVSISDPLGLLSARDYLPCLHAFECFPQRSHRRDQSARNLGAFALQHGGKHVVRQIGTGSMVRELRDYQPGDPLRHIAWKATARNRRLISRDFEREVNLSMYLLLDISTSMRGGQWEGQKLEHGVESVAELATSVIGARDRVGLMTFDEKLYGHIPPATAPSHLARILRHLVGVNSVVDDELTEWGEVELAQKLADYLVVQERLDFRRGDDVEPESGVNIKLLERWLRSVIRLEKEKFDSPILHDGLLDEETSLLRRFAQLRGVEVPYRVEARLGLKERGLNQAIERIVTTAKESQWIVVISDLCGVMNTEVVTRSIRLAQIKGHAVRFLVPFTPAYYEDDHDGSERYSISRELFSTREREERLKIASHLRKLGVQVDFMKPGQSALQLLLGGRGRRVAS